MSELLEAILEPGGAVSRAKPGFEPRPQQLEMARAVEEALAGRRPLAVEAGTGVGKSLAYLVPAALWAAQQGKRVAVATYTRALQDQLVDKDLPVVAAALAERGLAFRFGALKGAENYLCAQRLRHAISRTDPESPESSAELARLAEWARDAKTGLRGAIPWEVPRGVWSRVCRDPDVCLGRRGSDWGDCLFRKDLERAEFSHVLVINHRLLFSEARLPPFEALIVDEAHHLEDVAGQGPEVSRRKVRRFLEDVYGPRSGPSVARDFARRESAWLAELAGLHAACGAASEAFFDALGEACGPAGTSRRLRHPPEVEDHLTGPLNRLLFFLKDAAPLCSSAEEQAELTRLLRRATELGETTRALLAVASPDHAYWIERSEKNVALKSAPLVVSEVLAAQWARRPATVVLTSATLSAGGSFEPFLRDAAQPEARALRVDSPFDYASRAGLFIDRGMPDPDDETAFVAAAMERLKALLELVPGGLFVLAPSRRLMLALHAALGRASGGRPLFLQGEADSHRLLEGFRKAGNGVLVGTDTFWQGVDVPGPALACVVIAKLPFASPDSPVEQARMERLAESGGNPFKDYSLPRAIIKFRQGFGRLIRHREDHGVVVVLDPRVARKTYGRLFLRVLPPCRRLMNLDEVGAFFKEFAVPAA